MKHGKFLKSLGLCALTIFVALRGYAQVQTPLRIITTTDVHGNYFPYDFTAGKDGNGSLARIYKYIEGERAKYGRDNVLLLDVGDILQGQPSSYYYNFMDTVSTHVCASVLNFMGYDAMTIGNHDIETGHKVYDRFVSQCDFPVLAANAINILDGKCYWKPYTIVEKAGKRIAVFGLITPTIPRWLPNSLWSGMKFEDMVEEARLYLPDLRRKADIVVGIFHSGVGKLHEGKQPQHEENAALAVAQQVPGFDIIFCGHDHRRADTFVVNTEGDTVRVFNAGPNAEYVSAATVRFEPKDKKNIIEGGLVSINGMEPDHTFMHHFADKINTLKAFTKEVIGKNKKELTTQPAFFGPSPFIDFIHRMQLKISKADISFAAPLSFDGKIERGDVTVGDMFTLYRFENRLYVMSLTGQEIKDYLEYSYAGWTRQITESNGSMLNFIEPEPQGIGEGEGWKRLAVPSYNFDSAAGLLYTVDVTKPAGQKITIVSLANGEEFKLDKKYRVAMNSYRGNGGGQHLTRGAHIPKDQLQRRIVWTTERDLRYYLMQEIRSERGINAKPLNQWKFIPEKLVKKIRSNDEKRLFR